MITTTPNPLPKQMKPTYIVIHVTSGAIISAYTNKSLAKKIAETNKFWFVRIVPTYRGKA